MPNTTKTFPNALSGARVLIFGGTSGIGAAVASGAVSADSKLHISSSSAANIEAAISQLRAVYPSSAASASLAGTPADLTDAANLEASIRAVLDAAISSLGGPLDHIIFTSGDLMSRPALAELTLEGVDASMRVRYIAPLFIGKLLAAHPGKYLRQASSSSITLTSGLLSRRPRAGMASVGGVTGAVEVLSKNFAVEFAPIRTNAIVLGTIDTELLHRLAGAPEVMEAFGNQTLVKKLGTPEDAAEAYLMCMRSAFVTGHDLVVDGGLLYV